MKINFINVAFIMLVSIFFVSCGGSKTEEVTVKPKTTSLKGDLKEYYDIVDKDYKIKVDENSYMNEGMITVEVKRNQKDFDFKTDNINPFGTNGSEDYHVGFGIEIFNESAPSVIKNATEGGMNGVYSGDDIKGLIQLEKGETGYIRWTVSNKKLKGLKTFRITSALKKEVHNDNSYTVSSNTSSSNTNSDKIASSTSNSNGKMDKALDSYEDYVDEYIKFLKKSSNGDISAMSEYPELMEKATKMQQKIQGMNNDFTTKQLARMMKIQTKMTNAALELQLSN